MKVKIVEMLRDGRSYNEITTVIGCSKATISYHAKRLGLSKGRLGSPYDWAAIAAHYAKGFSLVECIQEFGFSRGAWNCAVKAGRVKARPNLVPLKVYLVKGRMKTAGNSLKKRLINEGILKPQCSICRISDWLGKRLSLQIDHINGDKHDNRLVNLRLLCPNCHSQTDTWGARNIRRTKALQSAVAESGNTYSGVV